MNFVAIILIICSSVALAYCFIRKEIKHCGALSEAIRIVEYISGRANHFNEPLAEILKSEICEDKKLFRNLSICFENELMHKTDVPDAWRNSVKYTFDGILEDYECDVLIHFGKNLCRCSTYEIENLKEKTISDLEDFRNTALENKNTKSKSTAAITVSVGVIIVLMFA